MRPHLACRPHAWAAHLRHTQTMSVHCGTHMRERLHEEHPTRWPRRRRRLSSVRPTQPSCLAMPCANQQPPPPEQCALTAREKAPSSSLEADEAATMRSHAAAPDAMNDASATLEWSPTMVLSGRKLKGAASMSRLEQAQPERAVSMRRRREEIGFVQVLTLFNLGAEGVDLRKNKLVLAK